MDSLFDSKLVLGAAGLAAVALGALAVVHLQRADTQHEAAPARVAASWDNPIGPGQLAGPVRDPAALGLDPQAARAARLPVDADGHLVPGTELRSLLDSTIGAARGEQRRARAGQLEALLKTALRAPAAGEAARIAADYVAYLETEEQLLARERFTGPAPDGLSVAEVNHLLAWQQQRAQLRQRMLGSAVAKAFFGADDAACSGALADWRLQQQPDDSPELDSNELQNRGLHGQALAERRNGFAQACATQIMEGLGARE